MKVLHVFGAMDVGGAEMRTLELMRELAPRDVEFHFLTLSGRLGVLADEIRALGGDVHPIPLTARFPWSFARLVRRVRPDVVDSHVATFSGAILMLSWASRVPRRIAHFRSDGDGHADSVRRRIQRSVMVALIRLFATDIVGVSPSALAEGYRSDWEHDRRARVVVNGVPPFEGETGAPVLRALVDKSAAVILHVGRPSKEKNRIHTVRVLHALVESGTDAHLALVGGSGPDTETIAAEAERLGVAHRVHDLGARRDARQLMSEADVLLLTSVREGLPGVVLEALSTGTPVVASALPGVRFIGGQLPGVYPVPLTDPVDRWAEAIEAALEQGRDREWRWSVKREFESSAFSQDCSRDNHLDLYSGTGRA